MRKVGTTLTTPKASAKARARRNARRWLVGGAVFVAAALAATIGYGLTRHRSGGTATRNPAPPGLVKTITQVPAAVWEKVGTRGAPAPQAVTGATGAPNLLYVGAEGCPYCAAERWVLTVALSRFGTFSHLALMTSSGHDIYPNTPTFSFYGATYHSPYLHVQLMEIAGRHLGPNGFTPPLMSLDATQQQLYTHFDGPPYVPAADAGSIPFVLVGGRYLWIGSPEPPQLLHGLDWTQIADRVARGQGSAGQSILANANELTAALCATDGQQPAAVCRAPAIAQAQRTLGQP